MWFIYPFLFTGDPLTIYTLPSSSAVLGSAALLKCRFNIGGPINLTTLQVRWYFSDRSVAQYDRGKETFAPGVSISQQELLIGNASLGMESVRVSDEGQYRCVVGYGVQRQQSETTLRVLGKDGTEVPAEKPSVGIVPLLLGPAGLGGSCACERGDVKALVCVRACAPGVR